MNCHVTSCFFALYQEICKDHRLLKHRPDPSLREAAETLSCQTLVGCFNRDYVCFSRKGRCWKPVSSHTCTSVSTVKPPVYVVTGYLHLIQNVSWTTSIRSSSVHVNLNHLSFTHLRTHMCHMCVCTWGSCLPAEPGPACWTGFLQDSSRRSESPQTSSQPAGTPTAWEDNEFIQSVARYW